MSERFADLMRRFPRDRLAGALVQLVVAVFVIGYVAVLIGVWALFGYAIIRFAEGRLLTDLCSEEARSDVLLCDTIIPWFATSRIIELAPRVPAWLVTSPVVTYFIGAVLALLQEQVPKIIGKAEISNPNLDRVTNRSSRAGLSGLLLPRGPLRGLVANQDRTRIRCPGRARGCSRRILTLIATIQLPAVNWIAGGPRT